MAVQFEIRKNNLPRAPGALRDFAQQALAKIAFDIEASAKDNVTDMGAIDTGALKNSGYTSTPDSSTYPSAVSGAQGLNPDANFAPEVRPAHALEVVIGFSAGYALYVDFGTAKMPGRPFFSQAVYGAKPTIDRLLGKELQNMAEQLSR